MTLAQHKIGKFIMSLFPDRNLFIVTSALRPNIGVVGFDDRVVQTRKTLEILKQKVPNDYILFVDGSPNDLTKEPFMSEVMELCDGVMLMYDNEMVKNFAGSGRKSEAETALLFLTLLTVKQKLQPNKFKRIFKFSARTYLQDGFDIKAYDDLFGKYVFKKRIPSWLPKQKQEQTTDNLFITRMFSMCPSLVDNYLETLQKNLDDIIRLGIDTEHAHFKNIDKKYVVEFDELHCMGIMAGTGAIETY